MTDEEFDKLMSNMATDCMPAAAVAAANQYVNRLRNRVKVLEFAYNQWQDKTEWLQSPKLPFYYLGQHRADVMTGILRDAKQIVTDIDRNKINLNIVERVRESLAALE